MFSNASAREIFKFDVTEIEITQNGNIIKGYNGGKAFTNDGISIKAKNFEYSKILALLISDGNVEMKDEKQDVIITANKISYFKNREIIIAETDVVLKDIKKNIIIKASKISYFKKEKKIIANKEVELIDNKKNIIINTNKITYLKEKDEIFTEGPTVADIQSKYRFNSSDVMLSKTKMELSSLNKTTIADNTSTLYNADKFNFQIKNELLKASNISIIQNTKAKEGESDRLFFESGFFDLQNKEFKTGY